MANDTLRNILHRRSARSFSNEPLEREKLEAVVEAGRCAPYAMKPCFLAVVRNAELLARLDKSAKEAARQMTLPHLRELGNDENFHCLYHAPALILVCDDEQSVVLGYKTNQENLAGREYAEVVYID